MMKLGSVLADVTRLPELDSVPASMRNRALYQACVAAAFSRWGLAAVLAAAGIMALVSAFAPSLPYAVVGHAAAGAVGGHLWLRGIRAKLKRSGH